MKNTTPNPNLPANAQTFGPISIFSFPALDSGRVRHQTRAGRFIANHYEGDKFTTPELKSKAETGLWYCYAQGTGLGLEGEGSTPENALADLCDRAEAMRAELVRVYGLSEK